MLNKLVLILATGMLILSGCGAEAEEKSEPPKEEQAKEETNQYLFEEDGLTVKDVTGWSVGEKSNDPLVVSFNHQKLKAVATLLDPQKSFDQIKEELMAGAGNVELIDEKDDFFSYHSNNKESIKTEVYLTKGEERTLVLSFLAKKSEFDEVEPTIKEFQSAVELQN